MNEKVKRLKGEKVKGEGREMKTADQLLLEAAKSFDADVERAKNIGGISIQVARERCETCGMSKLCGGGITIPCRIEAIASVAVGMILEAKGGER